MRPTQPRRTLGGDSHAPDPAGRWIGMNERVTRGTAGGATPASRAPERERDVLCVVRETGELSAWGPGGRKLLGIGAGEALGGTLFGLFAGPVPDRLRDCWERRAPWSGEVLLRHGAGHRTPVDLGLLPLADGEAGTLWLVDAASPGARTCPGSALDVGGGAGAPDAGSAAGTAPRTGAGLAGMPKGAGPPPEGTGGTPAADGRAGAQGRAGPARAPGTRKEPPAAGTGPEAPRYEPDGTDAPPGGPATPPVAPAAAPSDPPPAPTEPATTPTEPAEPPAAPLPPPLTGTRPRPGDPDASLLKQWALEQLPLPMSLCDLDGIRVAVNPAMARTLVRQEPELIGMPIGTDRAGGRMPYPDEVVDAARFVLRTGEPTVVETWLRTEREPRPHAWLVSLYPVLDPAGSMRGVALACLDSTEQYQARLRLNTLNDAAEHIGTTLDLDRTADELAQVAVRHLADFAMVDMLDTVAGGDDSRRLEAGGSEVFRRVAHRSALPGCPEAVVAIGERHVPGAGEAEVRALAAGRPLLDRISGAEHEGWWRDRAPQRRERIRALGIHSILTVPLRARGATLGVAVLIRHRTPEPFDEEDARLAGQLAGRAAVCVDNARRYDRERRTALALQRTLLPEHAPSATAEAVEVASRYRPADPGRGIGGDWFDVIPLSGARVALVVGDVVGHGIEASATMGRLCTAVRTLADADVAPDELLTHIDDLVLRLDRQAAEEDGAGEHGDPAEVGATCLYAVYDPVSRRCSMARAGHPVPALVTPDGAARFLDVPAGPPLGVGGLPFEVAEFAIPEGSVLAFVTNGLTNGLSEGAPDECAVFRDVLTVPGRSLDAACDELLERLLPERRTDDAALLLARTKALAPERVATWQLGSQPAAVAEARAVVTATLAEWGLPELEFTAELVVSELVTNAIRYGRPPVRLRLIRDDALICEVADSSATAPHLRRARTYDEGGRGLFIVAQLTRRWGSRQTPAGKTIWADLPLPAGG